MLLISHCLGISCSCHMFRWKTSMRWRRERRNKGGAAPYEILKLYDFHWLFKQFMVYVVNFFLRWNLCLAPPHYGHVLGWEWEAYKKWFSCFVEDPQHNFPFNKIVNFVVFSEDTRWIIKQFLTMNKSEEPLVKQITLVVLSVLGSLCSTYHLFLI